MKLVKVLWRDAETSHGWEEVSEFEAGPPLAITVGILITDKPTFIVVANTKSGDMVNGTMKIPRKMIVIVKELNEK